MKHEEYFSLALSQPANLVISWEGEGRDMVIMLNEEIIAKFPNHIDLMNGQEVILSDGNTLSIKLKANIFNPSNIILSVFLNSQKLSPNKSLDPSGKLIDLKPKDVPITSQPEHYLKKLYLLKKGNEITGPFLSSDIYYQYKAHKINDDTLYCQQGNTDDVSWKPLREFFKNLKFQAKAQAKADKIEAIKNYKPKNTTDLNSTRKLGFFGMYFSKGAFYTGLFAIFTGVYSHHPDRIVGGILLVLIALTLSIWG